MDTKAGKIQRRKYQNERDTARTGHEGDSRGSLKIGDGREAINTGTTQRLSLPTSTLGNGLRVKNAGKLAEIGRSRNPLTEIEMELAKTKRELMEVKRERDI